MIKIAYVISNLSNQGPVNILYGILKYMDLKEVQIYIITLKKETTNSRTEDFKRLGVEILPCYISYKNLFLKKINRFNNILNEKKIQIVHCHCFKSAILVAKTKKVKKINTIHLDFATDYVYNYGKLKGFLLGKIYLKNLKKMDINISCGKGVRDLNLNNAKLNSEYIQNGVDLEIFNFKNKSKEVLRKKNNFSSKYKYFISVGSLDERKNIFSLAKIFSKFENRNLKLVIIGSGKEKENILKLKSKNIIFLGQMSIFKVRDYLKASDFYISASKSEGLPNSVLEACAMGLPCVLSNIEPHKEILELQSNSGLVYKLNNEEDLKNKIKSIVEVNYKEYSQNSLKIVNDYLNAKNMSEKYRKIYLDILK